MKGERFDVYQQSASVFVSTADVECIMKKTKERETMDDHILSREERIRESREFNLLSDVFLSVALDDAPACQHIIRILTGIEDLTVKEVRTQYVITKINSRTVRLDVLAEDSDGETVPDRDPAAGHGRSSEKSALLRRTGRQRIPGKGKGIL